MISNDLKTILLLNPVKINYDLAKWRRESLFEHDGNGVKEGIGMSGGMTVGGSDGFWQNKENVWDGVPFVVRREFHGKPMLKKLAEAYIKFRLLFQKPKKDPVEFFMEVKDNFMELEKTDVDQDQIQPMLKRLNQSMQRFAASSMLSENNLKRTENKLVEAGFTQYQTEESLIKFIKQCKKGLCLTELEYFDRVIPDDVLVKFDAAEKTKLFDNYYIMHYDPKKADNIFYTTDKPKDPIMFGVLQGSKKLYLVADWIDEFCNLTYKDILDSKCSTDFKLKMQEILD